MDNYNFHIMKHVRGVHGRWLKDGQRKSSLEEMFNSAWTQSEIISYRGGFWTGFQEMDRILPGGEERGGTFQDF